MTYICYCIWATQTMKFDSVVESHIPTPRSYLVRNVLRFCRTVWWTLWRRKIVQPVLCPMQNRSTEGSSQLKSPETRQVQDSGEIGLDIRTHASPNVGQDQVSGGVSVLCWLAAPVAMFYGNLQNLVIRSKSVIKSSSVIGSQIGVMSDQLRLSLYTVMSQNVM